MADVQFLFRCYCPRSMNAQRWGRGHVTRNISKKQRSRVPVASAFIFHIFVSIVPSVLIVFHFLVETIQRVGAGAFILTILINNFNAQRQRSTRFSNRGVFFSDEIARSCLQPPSRSQKQRLDRTRWRILFHPQTLIFINVTLLLCSNFPFPEERSSGHGEQPDILIMFRTFCSIVFSKCTGGICSIYFGIYLSAYYQNIW